MGTQDKVLPVGMGWVWESLVGNHIFTPWIDWFGTFHLCLPIRLPVHLEGTNFQTGGGYDSTKFLRIVKCFHCYCNHTLKLNTTVKKNIYIFACPLFSGHLNTSVSEQTGWNLTAINPSQSSWESHHQLSLSPKPTWGLHCNRPHSPPVLLVYCPLIRQGKGFV